MWIVTNQGFFSVVAKDEKGAVSGKSPDSILSVRFRRVGDAARLFPNHEVILTPHGDYSCRVFATRRDVATMLAEILLNMDYDNFKNSIPKADNDLYAASNAAWSVFGKLQPGGPYGRQFRQTAFDLDWDRDWDDITGYNLSLPGLVMPVAKKSKHKRKHKPHKPLGKTCNGCGMGNNSLNEVGLCGDCSRIVNQEL